MSAVGSSSEIASAQTILSSSSYATDLVSTMQSKDSSLSGMTASIPFGIKIENKGNTSLIVSDSCYTCT